MVWLLLEATNYYITQEAHNEKEVRFCFISTYHVNYLICRITSTVFAEEAVSTASECSYDGGSGTQEESVSDFLDRFFPDICR